MAADKERTNRKKKKKKRKNVRKDEEEDGGTVNGDSCAASWNQFYQVTADALRCQSRAFHRSPRPGHGFNDKRLKRETELPRKG